MRKGVKMALAIIAIILALTAIEEISAYRAVKKVADADEYKLGDDAIGSIGSVVGERKVASVSTSVENRIQIKQIEYDAEGNAQEDVAAYMKYLTSEEGFVLIRDIGSSEGSTTIKAQKESVDEGKIIWMTIDYNPFGYTITIQKGEGSLTQ
jgi:hypothetical protein